MYKILKITEVYQIFNFSIKLLWDDLGNILLKFSIIMYHYDKRKSVRELENNLFKHTWVGMDY